MDDVGKRKSVFLHKGSHHLNDDRVEVERLQNIYTSIQHAGRLSEIPDEWINRAACKCSSSSTRRTQTIAKTNTMIVANVCGYVNVCLSTWVNLDGR